MGNTFSNMAFGWSGCGGRAAKLGGGTTAAAAALSIFLVLLVLVFSGGIDSSTFMGSTLWTSGHAMQPNITYSLNCSNIKTTQTCPAIYPTRRNEKKETASEKCPEYFRWIHEDLLPWSEQGITLDMVEHAKNFADIRIVVVNGSVYVEKYRGVFQTRDVFTIWGILQLLRLYPGRLPDLDFMFQCGDKPLVRKRDFTGEKTAKIPPVFHYCGDNDTLDIAFPDWSFWGWPEINIPPWNSLREELEEGNHRIKWAKRKPYAYWKGNIHTSGNRIGLMKCNVNAKQDWNARIYHLDWGSEIRDKFKSSNLADQCNYRYKIYVEGIAWSVSEKYILACDAMTLLIEPQYYDFFTRSLVPTVHYWPINKKDMCRSIKSAVDWGNKNTQMAQKIGKGGSIFIQEQLRMKDVYNYMFHLLDAYGKLLRYKPVVPPKAVQMCSETMGCTAAGLEKKFKMESMVRSAEDGGPCVLPPPYTRPELQAFLDKKANLNKNVGMWEDHQDPF